VKHITKSKLDLRGPRKHKLLDKNFMNFKHTKIIKARHNKNDYPKEFYLDNTEISRY